MLRQVLFPSTAVIMLALANAANGYNLEYCTKAEKARDARSYDQAIEFYTRCLAGGGLLTGNGGHPDYNKGESVKGVAELRRAVRLKPKYAEAFNGRGSVYLDKHDYDHAIADFDRAIQLKSDYAEAFANRGRTYRDLGDSDRAIAEFDRAIELDPVALDAIFSRAIAYEGKGDNDRANADYDRIIAYATQALQQWAPNDPIVFLARGLAYDRKDDYENAISDFNQAIRLKPDFAVAFYSRGLTYHSKVDNNRAIADFDRTVRLDPDFVEAFSARGNSYRRTGEYGQAIADYDHAVRLDPNAVEAFLDRGLTRFYQGNVDAALRGIRKSVALVPGLPYPPIWAAIARGWQARGGFKGLAKNRDDPAIAEKAHAAAKAEIKNLMHGPSTANWPGPVQALFAGKKTPEELFELAESGTEKRRREKTCEATYFVGQFRLLAGQIEEAMTLFERASRTCPKNFIEYTAAGVETARIKALGLARASASSDRPAPTQH